MSHLSRRQFLAGATATAAAVTTTTPRVHAQKKGGTLRFIPHADLKITDPIATTAYITRNHSYMIYDTLFGTDAGLAIKPQMVEKFASTGKGMKWTFTLREGLRFHDGHAVAAEDAVESLKRWSKRDPLGRLLAAHTARLVPVDRRTFALELAEPFGLVLEALGKPSSNVPFVMPARIAATSENEPIKEPIGSGPFKFVKDEWQPGNQVVYVRNPDYVPRAEKPSGSTGGKVVALDRVVWRYIPDHATANAALEAGEIDWWENPPLDFVPKIEANSALTTFITDPRGTQGWIRPNHKHPPFNNKKARQALLYLVDQP
jgi:peptide/nickel transport system substrate-binding protein